MKISEKNERGNNPRRLKRAPVARDPDSGWVIENKYEGSPNILRGIVEEGFQAVGGVFRW